MNVIVETIPEFCGHEDQSKQVEGYIEEIKNTLLSKNFVYDIQETLSITEASFKKLVCACSCLQGCLYYSASGQDESSPMTK